MIALAVGAESLMQPNVIQALAMHADRDLKQAHGGDFLRMIRVGAGK
jgi:hypothetical protein